MRPVILIAIAVLLVPLGGLQAGEIKEPGPYRYTYQGEDVPDYLAFNMAAQILREKSKTDSAAALRHAERMFGTTVDSDPYELIQHVETYLTDLDAASAKVARRGYCARVRSASKKNLYRTLDDFEDARHVRMMEHYERFLVRLNNHSKAALDDFLKKQSGSYYAVDHELAYESSSHDVQEVLSEYCNQLQARKND